MVDVAAGASAVIKLPFIVIQNTWDKKDMNYNLGVASESEFNAGVPLGNLTA